MIYIPAYWWYSIKFNTISSIAVFQYRTYMNTLAIMPDIMMSFLQSQNIKRESIDKLEISEPDNKPSEKID